MWSGLSTTDTIRLETQNRRAARLILKVPSSSPISQDQDILLAPAGLQFISIRRKLRQAMFCFKYFKGFHPEHLKLYRQLATCSKSAHNRRLTFGRTAHFVYTAAALFVFQDPEEYFEELSLLLCFFYMELPSRTNPFSSYVCFHQTLFFVFASLSLLIHLTGPSLFYSCTLLSMFAKALSHEQTTHTQAHTQNIHTCPHTFSPLAIASILSG